MSLLLVVGLFALWSSVFSFGKVMLAFASPALITGLRMLLSGLVLLVFLCLKDRKWTFPRLRDLLPIALLGLLSIYLTNVLEFWGLQYLTSAKTCFIYSLSPFFAALLSYLHFKEKMTIKKALGLLLGFVGIIPALSIQEGFRDLWNLQSLLTLPVLAVAGAAFFSVYGWVLMRVLVKTEKVSPVLANSYSMLIGGVLALGHALISADRVSFSLTPGSFSAFSKNLLLMTLLYNLICYNLYGFLLKKYTATFLSFMGLLSPFFASFYGLIFLGEPLSPSLFYSTGILTLGLWLVYGEELRQGYLLAKKSPPSSQ